MITFWDDYGIWYDYASSGFSYCPFSPLGPHGPCSPFRPGCPNWPVEPVSPGGPFGGDMSAGSKVSPFSPFGPWTPGGPGSPGDPQWPGTPLQPRGPGIPNKPVSPLIPKHKFTESSYLSEHDIKNTQQLCSTQCVSIQKFPSVDIHSFFSPQNYHKDPLSSCGEHKKLSYALISV